MTARLGRVFGPRGKMIGPVETRELGNKFKTRRMLTVCIISNLFGGTIPKRVSLKLPGNYGPIHQKLQQSINLGDDVIPKATRELN